MIVFNVRRCNTWQEWTDRKGAMDILGDELRRAQPGETITIHVDSMTKTAFAALPEGD